MKQISAKMFFTVLWRGLCQALGWFFGLFGYKRDGKFAKCVWGVFAVSATFITCFFATFLVCAVAEEISDWYARRYRDCDHPRCSANVIISRDIYFHNHCDGKGYVYNKRTGEKFLRHVDWIVMPLGKDSLVCFSDGKNRGYFSRYTGKVVVQPQYSHAWIFSDGLASVEEGGYIKFIDTTGRVVIDKKMVYSSDVDGYVFHGGYCVVDNGDGEHYGLMDKKGNFVLPVEYNSIQLTDDLKMWVIQKGNEFAVLDKNLRSVIPFMRCSSMSVGDETIDVTMYDHTIRKYNYDGELINDFYVTCVRMLEYEKEDMACRKNMSVDDGASDEMEEYYHPQATARLRSYAAGDGYEGLMTKDGRIVTMPIYMNIEALDHDLYLCEVTDGDKVIVNGKGGIVK